jgi:glucokinase
MKNNLAIGIDIGGTRTKFGLVDLNTGEVIDTLILPTVKKDAALFLEQIGMAVEKFKAIATKEKPIAGIGIGIPGFTQEDGVVTTTYGFLEFMENYPVKQIIEEQFSLTCLIDNDARVVALGEALYGKGKDYKRVLTLTLGTGVGFGLVVNGKFTEPLPMAHMGGHMKITDAGGECYCGKTGCLEALVSSTGIIQLAKDNKLLDVELSAEAIFAAAANGNSDAIKVVDKVIGYLHTGIHNYANLFAPDMIVLGGGVAKGLYPYLKNIKGKNYLSAYPGYDFTLAVSALEEQAGILGSAALFQAFNQ